MALGLTHFAIGATGMIVLLSVFAPGFQYQWTAVVASGLWALGPDIHYVSPILTAPLSGIKHTPVGDLFWFHRSLDTLHQGRGTRGGAAVAVGLLLIAAIVGDRVVSRESTG